MDSGLYGAQTVASVHASVHDTGKVTVIKVSNTGRFSHSKVGVDKPDMKSVEADNRLRSLSPVSECHPHKLNRHHSLHSCSTN